MTNRRYFLVILDSSGRTVRRVSVSRQLLRGVLLGAAILALIGTAITAHGLSERAAAVEVETLAKENQLLRATYAELNARLPAQRVLAMKAELTFAQLWAKSGLGSEPRTLGVGPLESPGTDGAGSELGVPMPSTHHLLALA